MSEEMTGSRDLFIKGYQAGAKEGSLSALNELYDLVKKYEQENGERTTLDSIYFIIKSMIKAKKHG